MVINQIKILTIDNIFSFLCTSSRNKKDLIDKTIENENSDNTPKSEEDKSSCSIF